MESHFNPIVREIDELPKPVVAAVNGVTAGGGVGLALSADIVVAAKSAKFIQVFAPRLGIIPDMGSTWYLNHLLGRARARALTLTGEPLPAETAADWGLIWKCVEDNALMEEAMGLAQKLAAGSTKAFQMTMAALDAAENNDLAAQLEVERYIQGQMTNRADFAEGVTAFLEKREPKFSAG
jgi:2-(1,2-epoxy-1,2-dihydrophenyl)acetyl-CoA isomerase